jgi:tetratricopeptide (TPR) repeat protein
MSHPSVPPSLAELLTRYLQEQASAHAAGLAFAETGAVVPHEAAPVQPIDPKLAWDEALAAARCFRPGRPASLTAPADWPALVAAREAETGLPFCVGNFPQLVRDLLVLLQTADLASLPAAPGRPLSLPALREAAEALPHQAEPLQVLATVGTLRLAREFDRAAELLSRHGLAAPADWQPCWANERAALAWHRGQREEAAALWQIEPDSVPVRFNRGMAALFLGRPVEARSHLSAAVQQLPAASGWHHLGRLYLALAEMRGA